MTKAIKIEQVQQQDLADLQQVMESTFLEAFADINDPEFMASYCRDKFSLKQVESELNHPNSRFYFLRGGEIITGYLKLNVDDAQNEQLLSNALELERIYIKQAYQNRGYGQALLDFAIKRARAMKKEWVWLGVWEHNHGAQKLYKRYGFTRFDQHDFYLGPDRQIDLLMKLRL